MVVAEEEVHPSCKAAAPTVCKSSLFGNQAKSGVVPEKLAS